MAGLHRSGCPINLSLEVMGDRWSLIILRDMIFGAAAISASCSAAHSRASRPTSSPNRMKHLVALGMLTAAPDPTHKQKVVYSLTEMSIELVPVLAALGAWGSKWLPVTAPLSVRATTSRRAAPRCGSLHGRAPRGHLGIPANRRGKKVREVLQEAYDEVVAEAR